MHKPVGSIFKKQRRHKMKYFLLILCAWFAPFVAADFGIGLCPPKPQTLREFDQERVRAKLKIKAGCKRCWLAER